MSAFDDPVEGQIVVITGPNDRRLTEVLLPEARRRQWGIIQFDQSDQASMRTLLAALVRSLGKVEPPHYTHARRSLASTLVRRVEGLLLLGLQRDHTDVAAFLRWLASHERRPVVVGIVAERWAALEQADREGRLQGLVARQEAVG